MHRAVGRQRIDVLPAARVEGKVGETQAAAVVLAGGQRGRLLDHDAGQRGSGAAS